MTQDTKVDQFTRRLKSHPAISALILGGTIVIGLAAFTDSLDKIWMFVEKRIWGTCVSEQRRAAQLAAIREINGEAVPLANKIPRAAFPLSQGRPDAGRDAQELLDRWVMEYRGVLPEKVMDPLAELHRRVSVWRSNMGENDTPGAMIERKNAPLSNLLQAIERLEKELLDARTC